MAKIREFLVKAAVALATIGGALSGLAAILHYTGTIDVQPLLDSLNAQVDSLASVGISLTSASAVTIAGRSIYMAFRENQAKILNNNLDVMKNVQLRLKTIEDNQNKLQESVNVINNLSSVVLEFERVIALKNLDSKVIGDDVKKEIKLWLDKAKERLTKADSLKVYTIAEVKQSFEQGQKILEKVSEIVETAKARL
jgi:hypothetical protein